MPDQPNLTPAMRAWQPIETAPKDGAVLLYFGNRKWRKPSGEPADLGLHELLVDRVEAAVCEGGDIYEAFTGHSVFEDGRHPDNTPTLWAPLEPPAGLAALEGGE